MKAELIPDMVRLGHPGWMKDATQVVSLRARSISYQLVGGVMAHQGFDG